MTLLDLRPRQPFTGLAVAAVLGILLADRWPAPIPPFLCALGVGAALLWWKPSAAAAWGWTCGAFAVLHTINFHGAATRELARQFEAGPRVVSATGMVCNEPQKPAYWSRKVSGFFRLKLESLSFPGIAEEFASSDPAANGGDRPPVPQPLVPAGADVVVNVNWAGPLPAYGDRITLLGSAQNLARTRNPGQFDFAEYLHRQGIYSEISVRFSEDGKVFARAQGSRLQAYAYRAQHWITDQLELDLKGVPEISALIESMVLGLRGDALQDTQLIFQRTGTMHLFAVSGLNVAMLAAILLQLLRAARVNGPAAICLTLPILAFYAVVTGLSASCLRATIMGTLILIAPLLDRRAVAYNSLCAAAFLVLAWDTNQLFLPGFQFSFVLVLVIVAFARRIQNWFEPWGAPDPFLPRSLLPWRQRARERTWHFVAEALGVALAAWAGSLLFTAGYFHLFSPCSIAANLLAVPISFFILALGVAALVTAAFWQGGAILFNNANWLAAKTLLLVVSVFARAPGGHLYVELPRGQPRPIMEMTALDLGAGAGIHLRTAGRDWMIDCGSAFSYGHVVVPYLRTRGVNQLDGLLLTHGDTQHIGGALGALDDFQPRCVIDSVLRDHSSTRRRLHQELARRRLGKRLCQPGDVLRLSDAATLRVLFPPAGWSASAADDKALVVQVECAGTRVLLTADSGFTTEQWLVEHVPDLRSDILIKGQHAKDLSGTPDFMTRVAPQAVVCSPLESNQSPDALDAWERQMIASGIVVFRQDHAGAVRIELQATGGFSVSAFAQPQALHGRARSSAQPNPRLPAREGRQQEQHSDQREHAPEQPREMHKLPVLES